MFAQALLERDPGATPEQCGQAREKAFRAPVLMLVVVDGERGDPEIDLAERLLSAGCAVQNMLLMATAQGYGSALTSGKALKAASLRALFRLSACEQALCFISIGTVLVAQGDACAPHGRHLRQHAGRRPGRGAWILTPANFFHCEIFFHGYFQLRRSAASRAHAARN